MNIKQFAVAINCLPEKFNELPFEDLKTKFFDNKLIIIHKDFRPMLYTPQNGWKDYPPVEWNPK